MFNLGNKDYETNTFGERNVDVSLVLILSLDLMVQTNTK